MKDIEKIKSEDLAAQVQDANPANFAIEQEVAAMVGATVPAPTEPSADDARELGAQLLVFLRRALTPIQTALRIAVAAIYAHLDSRCTDYTPAAYAPYQPLPSYDPMGTPPTPRTLPNLLTALTAFSARKISNGSATADGIPDGMSLAHLLGSSTDYNAVTKIIDDNPKWSTWNKALPVFPNLKALRMNCETCNTIIASGASSLEDVQLPYTKTINAVSGSAILWNIKGKDEMEFPELEVINLGSNSNLFGNFAECKKLSLPKFKYMSRIGNASFCDSFPLLEELYMPEFGGMNGGYGGWPSAFNNNPNLKKVVMGKILYTTKQINADVGIFFGSCPKLIDLEIGAETAVSLQFSSWNPDAETIANPLFLQNFKEHIALRLTSNGSGKTLTLSQAVRDAIHAAEATYGIEAIIVTQKGWTLSPAPGASSQ